MTVHNALNASSIRRKEGRLVFLELNAGRIHTMDPDGSNKTTIVNGCRNPDGVVIDAEAGHIYWTNMGVPSLNDGSIERADLDGANRITIVSPGTTFTPKQIHFDKRGSKLYWSDREGMRVMRCDLDGTNVETLVETGSGDEDRKDQMRWCVGITLDDERGEIYWTQKGPDNAGLGRIFRAPLSLRQGEAPNARSDIELVKDGLPEPIDLEIADGRIYWTDRGDPPAGNSVSRMRLETSDGPNTQEIVFTHLMEGIGIALDAANDRMFMTDLAGCVYCARLDGTDAHAIAAGQGNLTGIAYAEF